MALLGLSLNFFLDCSPLASMATKIAKNREKIRIQLFLVMKKVKILNHKNKWDLEIDDQFKKSFQLKSFAFTL
ncbi:hypothetical protein BpHYR1_053996 [Brachionus plicatilis]|uniref:Uncharacterized protein n=1 Tax=Brachionus plicatilis TaxID=10195 RepID=A0A3M7S541_BRAPC|nr:hypothetical protein BpHYR1_053996 [Brachionus plicatilis]